jgi:hypothetical protein
MEIIVFIAIVVLLFLPEILHGIGDGGRRECRSIYVSSDHRDHDSD